MERKHAMPFGAEVLADGSVRFRLWAPAAKRVTLCLENGGGAYPLLPLENGWFERISPEATAGSLYRFQIDDQMEMPDPASRFQPQDVHGPSEVVDATAFQWREDSWRGRPWEEAVIYELHVGTFTTEGTFRGVEQKLDYLRDLGVTALELMPVADFPGTRNWGYDGVLLFAPDSSYGRPEDLKQLVQAAHAKGLMIFLDVVYNHFGPEGNYLHAYAPQFFTNRHHTPLSIMRSTGSRNITSMASASTPCTRSSMCRVRISSPNWRKLCGNDSAQKDSSTSSSRMSTTPCAT
jgi:maltooligosyltrehalose trehalohydrolase